MDSGIEENGEQFLTSQTVPANTTENNSKEEGTTDCVYDYVFDCAIGDEWADGKENDEFDNHIRFVSRNLFFYFSFVLPLLGNRAEERYGSL